jgi:hypothetical protein
MLSCLFISTHFPLSPRPSLEQVDHEQDRCDKQQKMNHVAHEIKDEA